MSDIARRLRRIRRHLRIGVAVGVGMGVVLSCSSPPASAPPLAGVPAALAPNGQEAQAGQEWRMGGHDYHNSKSNPDEHAISTSNAHELAIKWTYTAHGDTSAIPTVADGAVYVPDWGGYFTRARPGDRRGHLVPAGGGVDRARGDRHPVQPGHLGRDPVLR